MKLLAQPYTGYNTVVPESRRILPNATQVFPHVPTAVLSSDM